MILKYFLNQISNTLELMLKQVTRDLNRTKLTNLVFVCVILLFVILILVPLLHKSEVQN